MADSPTPARVRALEDAAHDRETSRELLSLVIGVFQKLDLLAPSVPLPTELHNDLEEAARRLRRLNVDIGAVVADVQLQREEPETVPPMWPEIRRRMESLLRAARWLWANESKVRDRVAAETWYAVDHMDLINALTGTERLAVLFGYPTTTTKE